MESFCLRDYSLEELTLLAASFGHSSGRARNLYSAINTENPNSLNNLKKVSSRLTTPLRDAGYYISPLLLNQVSVSVKDEGTVKFLFTTREGLPIEAVLMPAPDNRSTLCLSSQCGCAMGCTFCNTAKMGLIRNLSAGEILDQYHQCADFSKRHRISAITNIVFMGMGEPFDNFDNVMKAFETLNHPLSTKISRNRITISTSGHVEGLKKLAKMNLRNQYRSQSQCHRQCDPECTYAGESEMAS